MIDTEVIGHVGWLIINRPEKLNAFSAAMNTQFDDALQALSNDPEVSVIVIRGEGRAFSVGNDVDGPGHDDRRRALDDWLGVRASIGMWLKIWDSPKPVIAAVQGYCMGRATMMAACCDITVVADDAQIGWPSLPLGGGQLAPISAWLIGPKKAKELSYIIGSRMTGAEAKEWGWANDAVPADQLLDTVTRLANRIAKTPVELLILKKRALNRVIDSRGFREAAIAGAEFDAIAHDSRSVEETRVRIGEIGMKAAIAEYTSDEPAAARG